MSPEEIRRIAESIADRLTGGGGCSRKGVGARRDQRAVFLRRRHLRHRRRRHQGGAGRVHRALGARARAAQAHHRVHARRDAASGRAARAHGQRRVGTRALRRQGPEEPAGHQQDPGHRRSEPHRPQRGRRLRADRAGALRRHRRDHAGHQPAVDDHLQLHRDGGCRQRRHLQPGARRQAGFGRDHPLLEPRHRRGGRPSERADRAWQSPPSSRRRR